MLRVLLISFAMLFSCSKKKENLGPIYSAEEIYVLLQDSSTPKDKADVNISFSEYAVGANRVDSRALVYEKLLFNIIKFETEEEAKKEAIRLNQYYSRNWLLDHVNGEPVLEDYLILKLKAVNPNKTVQRVPKVETHGAEHGSAHGEGHASEHDAPAAHH